MTHEDVRKSLELLDSVLAAYDDGIGEMPTCSSEQGNESKELTVNGEIKTRLIQTYDDSEDSESESVHLRNAFHHYPKDGATSHHEALIIEDETKFSPPPVPKRNPSTRLSSRENLSLSDSTENIYSNSFEIRRHIFDSQGDSSNSQSSKSQPKIKEHHNGTAPNQLANLTAITKRNTFDKSDLFSNDNDDVFVSSAKLVLSRSASASMIPAESLLQKSPSVASRRALYENASVNDAETNKRPIMYSDPSETSCPVSNSPFLRRKFTDSPKIHKRNYSDVYVCRSPVLKSVSNEGKSSSDESNEEKVVRLNKKFAEVKYLLKIKQIKPLTCGPPHFVPTPPPKKIARKLSDTRCNPLKEIQPSKNIAKTDFNLTRDKNIILNPPVTLVDTISDISCILPTDSPNKPPQLGLSYSMEDDLSPGVKELITSTPVKSATPSLSTFSQSISSLGYGSGQSDLDLNVSYKDDKVQIPINSLKSQTLPIGIKLGPTFNYVTNIDFDCDIENRVDIMIDENSIKQGNDSDHFRSSSAPPLKHLLARTSKFGKSKKVQREGKSKTKDDSVSLKSDLSSEDGIILRKVTTLDGSSSRSDFSEKNQGNSEEKTKRRSVWKSILRRK